MLIYEFRFKWDKERNYGYGMNEQNSVVKYAYSDEELKSKEISETVDKFIIITEAINPEITINVNELIVTTNLNISPFTITGNTGTPYIPCGENISYTSK
jgi:delta-aminolevulinic acid dehydratase/porphobilinogen synthase